MYLHDLEKARTAVDDSLLRDGKALSGNQSLNVSNLAYCGFCEQLQLLMNKC